MKIRLINDLTGEIVESTSSGKTASTIKRWTVQAINEEDSEVTIMFGKLPNIPTTAFKSQ